MSLRRWGVIQFPGSNCDHDALKVFETLPEINPVLHWHEDPIVKNQYEVLVIPGGFSFGDYLRAGAIAKLSPAMQSLPEAVDAGLHVMGICNGFQILLESKILPGFLHVNSHLRFISANVDLKITKEAFPWFRKEDVGTIVRYPVAHRFGNYQLKRIDVAEVDPVLQYCDNPNGSAKDIAGIYRKEGKGSVFGLMPHPERAAFEALRLTDGIRVFKNAVEALA